MARARVARELRAANYDVVYNLHGGTTATFPDASHWRTSSRRFQDVSVRDNSIITRRHRRCFWGNSEDALS
jgi:hypothetical protein